ncbi:MAG: 50S ribosomal protein L14 [Candidatus Daviesbacteria bacterium]|nr:MAG: 50S ribosomal protein L14 [Candidatus Daviesbacteria bacterium]
MAVQHRSILTVADNSGAKAVQIIQPLGGSGKRKAGLAELAVAVVKSADPNGQVKKSEIVRVVIVRVRKERRREDGSYIKFDDNAAVIVDKDGALRATRVFGPIAREVRDAGFTKIASLAQEIW